MELNKTEIMQIIIYLNKFFDKQIKDYTCAKEDIKTIKILLKKLKTIYKLK